MINVGSSLEHSINQALLINRRHRAAAMALTSFTFVPNCMGGWGKAYDAYSQMQIFRKHYLATFNPELEEFDAVRLQELRVRLWIRLQTKASIQRHTKMNSQAETKTAEQADQGMQSRSLT